MAIDRNQVVRESFEAGFGRMLQAEPTLKPYAKFATQHINMTELYTQFTNEYNTVNTAHPTWRDQKKANEIKNKLAEWIYVNRNTLVFDPEGQRVMFQNTPNLQARLAAGNNLYAGSGGIERFVKRHAPFTWLTQHGPVKWINKLRGGNARRYDEYNKAGESMREVYGLIAADPDQQRRTPGIYQAADTYMGLDFARVATDIMGEGGLLRPKEQIRIRKDIYKGQKYQAKKAKEEIKQYVASKAIAMIFGILGFAVLLGTGFGFTGNAINSAAGGGIDGNLAGLALGIFCLAIAGLIMVGVKNLQARQIIEKEDNDSRGFYSGFQI